MEAYQALAAVYDKMMDPQERRLWISSTLEILREHGLRPGDSVVDLACGTGAITLALAQEGYQLTGIDISQEMLTVARQNPRAGRVRWICQDMTDFSLHRPVSAVTCACDGINYLTDLGSVERCFASVYRSLLPGGVFLFDVSTRHKLTAMDGELYALDEEDGAYIWRNTLDRESQVLTMDITFFLGREDGLFEREDELHRQRAHSREELTAALEAAGFELRALYSGLGRSEARDEDLRHRYVAVRK